MILSVLIFVLFFQNDVQLFKPGDKVGASEATLLNMLKISPFSYGLIIEQGKSWFLLYGFIVYKKFAHLNT